MNLKLLSCLCTIFLLIVVNEANAMNQIRTYMAYSTPVDPARLEVIPDMDLSYALASTLVEWGPDKKPVSGLALEWEPLAGNICQFRLRPEAKWSDGSPILSQQIKKSFDRMFKKYPDDLRSLINMISEIKTPTKNTVEFILRPGVVLKRFLGKLTEPNYGVVRVNTDDTLNLHVTTGPFYLQKSTSSELVLKRNPNWHRFEGGVAEEVIIRRPPVKLSSETALLDDKWPNVIETSSLIDSVTRSKYEAAHFSIWNRPKDKAFIFELSLRSSNENGFNLFRYIAAHIDRQNITENLSGFSLSEQLFPEGFELFNPDYKCAKNEVPLPIIFKERPLEILISPERVNPQLRENIRRTILKITGVAPTFISVPLDKLGISRKKGQYDFYAGTIGLADPDPEGGMSYYFEGDVPVIPSLNNDFIQKLDKARKENDETKAFRNMRLILSDATCQGRVLPLYHLSTLALGRPEVDFSSIPETDESATLSKIRFKR